MDTSGSERILGIIARGNPSLAKLSDTPINIEKKENNISHLYGESVSLNLPKVLSKQDYFIQTMIKQHGPGKRKRNNKKKSKKRKK